MKSGIYYHLPNDHLSTEQKIIHLVPFYIQKLGQVPEFVCVNPEQIGDLREVKFPVVGVPEEVRVWVWPDRQMMRNHFLIGVNEDV